jgi:O-antigen/teichoic acid export membrane protein
LNTLLRQRLNLVLSKRLGANYVIYFDNIFWLASEKALQFVLAFLVGAYVARFLGPDQFGVFGYAQSIVNIAAVVASLGIDNIVVRHLVVDPAKRNEYLSAAALLRFCAGLLFLFLAAIHWLTSASSDRSALLVVIMMLSVPMNAISVLALDLQAIVASKYVVFARTCQSLIGSTLRLSGALLKLPVVAFALISTLEALLFTMLLVVYHGRATRPVRLKFPQASTLNLLMRDGWPLLLASVSIILYMRVDQVMLKAMRGDLETGIFIAAVRLSELLHFIPVIVCSSVYPSIVKAREVDPLKYAARTQLLCDGLHFVALILAFAFTFLARPMVQVLFGHAYLAAVPVLQVHVWSTIAVFLGVASTQWLLAEGLQFVSLITTAIGLLANLLLNFFLIPAYGALGAAIATTVSYTVAVFAGPLLVSKARPVLKILLKAVCLHWAWRRRGAEFT